MISRDYKSTPLLYGNEIVDYFIPKTLEHVKILRSPPFTPDFIDLKDKFYEVLKNPVGFDVSFHELLGKVYIEGKKVTVIVDDHTRPNIHTRIVLPILLKELNSRGVRKEDITILVATGSHRMPTENELKKILSPNLFGEWKKNIIIHNCDEDCRFIGKIKQTPIYINENIFHSCLVIPVTDSEYHYFAGQAGTVKSFCPGIAGRRTIRKNHPKMFDFELGFHPACRLGNTEGNPVIQEMKEIMVMVKKKISFFGIDAITKDDSIVYLNAGDIISLHNAATEPLRRLRVVEVDKPADLVFVSAGALGLNLYQASKGIHVGWNAVRKDGMGWIVVLAPCQDGVGNEAFYRAMYNCKDKPIKEALKYVIDTYCTEETFYIGNQKPVDLFRIIASVGEGNVKLLTRMDSELLKEVFLIDSISQEGETPQESLKRIVHEYLKIKPNPVIYILKDAGLLVKLPKS